MKNIFFCFLIALSISSCGKTTKSKIANDWKVTSYEEQTVSIDTNGYQLTGKTSFDANNYSYLLTDKASVVHFTKKGTVAYNNYTINKDGTWSWEMEFTYQSNITANPPLEKQIIKSSGTWSFVGKNKTEDFRKHERVLFNILSESEMIVNLNDPGNSKNSATTYQTGEYSRIYTVKESKPKKLILKLDHQNIQDTDGKTDTWNKNVLMTLEAKSRN